MGVLATSARRQMNLPTEQNPDRCAPFNCPKCGAPSAMPEDLGQVTVTCQYCEETFTIPRAIREAQERRLLQLRWLSGSGGQASNVVAIIVVLTIVGVLISGVTAFVA